MGYNNNNAGMHFKRHSHYGQYDDLKFYDELVRKQEMEKKTEKQIVNNHKEDKASEKDIMDAKNNLSKPTFLENQYHKFTKPAKNVSTIYEEACEQIDGLYNALYIYSVKNHKDLTKTSACVSKYLKDKSRDGSIDDMMFLSMITKMLDINIALLSTISEKDIKDTVYNFVIPAIEQDSYTYCSKIDDIPYLEKEFSLICYDNEDDIRKYYTQLIGAALKDNLEFLPDIYVHYNVKIYKDPEKEYYLTLSIAGYSKYFSENYLEYYDAYVYHEKTGKVAEFFEKNYKSN